MFAAWSSLSLLPEPRQFHCMAEIAENEVLIAGGFNFDLEKSTYIMDLTTGQTTKTGSLSKGRMNSACEFFNGMVYLVADGETEVYDPMTKLWKQGPTVPTKSQYHGNLIIIQNAWNIFFERGSSVNSSSAVFSTMLQKLMS